LHSYTGDQNKYLTAVAGARYVAAQGKSYRVRYTTLWLRAGVIAGTAQGSISVTADNVCNRATGTLQYDYTKEVLEYKIDVNYLTYSLYELKGEVTVAKCGSSRRRRRDVNDVVISVTISGDYESVLFHALRVSVVSICGFQPPMCSA